MTTHIFPFPNGLECKTPEDILTSDHLGVVINIHNREPAYRRINGILSPYEVKTDPDKAMRLRLFFQERVLTNLNDADSKKLDNLLGTTIRYIRRGVEFGIPIHVLFPDENHSKKSTPVEQPVVGFSKIMFTPKSRNKRRKKKHL